MTSRHVRSPAVAGTFYPGDAVELRDAVARLLAEAVGRLGREPAVRCIVAPHAGYVYSGPVAASAFVRLDRRLRRAVVIGPSHRYPVAGLALPGTDALATPLGELPVAADLAAAAAALPQVVESAAAHAREHSLEVELPFLQATLGGDCEVLPLLVGEATPDEVAEVLERTAAADDTAVVVSTDLSHYLAHETAHAVDEATAAEVLALATDLSPEQACGARPLNGFLRWAGRRGMRGELLDLRSSGDTAGDRRQVVGYGAFAFA